MFPSSRTSLRDLKFLSDLAIKLCNIYMNFYLLILQSSKERPDKDVACNISKRALNLGTTKNDSSNRVILPFWISFKSFLMCLSWDSFLVSSDSNGCLELCVL